jgi:hypothetical protein
MTRPYSKKGTENRWSDEVHVVKEVSGQTVTLTDGTTHRRNKNLTVPHNTVIVPTSQIEKNVKKVATNLAQSNTKTSRYSREKT